MTKEKHILTVQDLDNLIEALWCSDLCQISHGRQRIQLTLYLLLHAYTGVRAGAYIESGYKKGSKQCLTYKVAPADNQSGHSLIEMDRMQGFMYSTTLPERSSIWSRSLSASPRVMQTQARTRGLSNFPLSYSPLI